ncbi:MAG: hypothetical protein IJ846_07935 [Alphaproteobacteria bacterium]|nr:hypothetical protein [Alphaproteobacteria bacterium]
MGKFFNKLFSVQKSKFQKIYSVLGMKFQVRNYKYMIREMYKWQNHEQLKQRLKMQNITLPEDALLFGETELVKIALKDIRRIWKGKIYALRDVSPFKYLEKRDKDIYISYILKHFSSDNRPSESELEKYLSDFNKLEASINENGYDLSKSIIALNRNNVVIDGQRRACILLYKYGGDYEITVVRER